MNSAARRRVAWTSGGAGIAVLIVIVLMSRERLVEEWRLSLLRSGSERLRLGAIERLGGTDSPRALTALYALSNDPQESPSVRDAAAHALGRIAENIKATTSWEPLFFTERLNQPDT